MYEQVLYSSESYARGNPQSRPSWMKIDCLTDGAGGNTSMKSVPSWKNMSSL